MVLWLVDTHGFSTAGESFRMLRDPRYSGQ